MGQKKPLVLGSDNVPQQLQAGDYIQTAELPQLTNGEAGSIVIGAPVYNSANDTVKKAKADAGGTLPCIGLVADTSIATGVTGGIMCGKGSILSATTGQWDAVTGGSGGLVANTLYYVSTATAGLLTTTPPTTGYSQVVGRAISTTEMRLDIQDAYKL
ncbi:MAG TPA: hypothetical protein VJY62_02390 [Bacteroidia bacterium]|nr:hypothetical protein [Bacteroidia bacterium]